MATRAELNEQAKELGLNPEDYANIDEITAAIRDNQPGLDDDPQDENEDEKADTKKKPTLEPGTRVELGGRFGEVLDPYEDGHRVRFDDGTTEIVQ